METDEHLSVDQLQKTYLQIIRVEIKLPKLLRTVGKQLGLESYSYNDPCSSTNS
jgi:hypothetical protein